MLNGLKKLMHRFFTTKVEVIGRDLNCVADGIARHARKNCALSLYHQGMALRGCRMWAALFLLMFFELFQVIFFSVLS